MCAFLTHARITRVPLRQRWELSCPARTGCSVFLEELDRFGATLGRGSKNVDADAGLVLGRGSKKVSDDAAAFGGRGCLGGAAVAAGGEAFEKTHGVKTHAAPI